MAMVMVMGKDGDGGGGGDVLLSLGGRLQDTHACL